MSPPTSPTRPRQCHLTPALALLCLSLAACETPSLLTIFTALAYTSDGQALVLEATDGVYLASPPDDTPERLGGLEQGCEGDWQYSLGCARIAADGSRLALLREMASDAAGTTTWSLWTFGQNAGGTDGRRVARGVLDATFTPDGGELLWTESGEGNEVALLRLGDDGAAVPVIDAIGLSETDSGSDALSALIITSAGVAYTRQGVFGLSLWFQPFSGGAPRELGVVDATCAGTGLTGCHALSHDGVTFAWQEAQSSILQIYRSDADLRLPVGSGASFRFSRAGSLLLRFASRTTFVHRADTAAIVREVQGSSAAQLSSDGETLAHLAIVSSGMKTSRLMVGPARQSDADSDLGIFTAPPTAPLRTSVAGSGELPFSFTGDGRFVIAAIRDESADPSSQSASIVAIDISTGESRTLDTLACSQCCQTASSGALVLCTPLAPEGHGTSVSLDLYDPASGLRTHGADNLLSYRVNREGTAVVLIDYAGDTPELKVVAKTGEVVSMGTAYQFALSPTESQVAFVNNLGKLSVEDLP